MGSLLAQKTPDIGITAQFLEKVLQSEIISFEVKAGCQAGDNFTSVLHSVRVKSKKAGPDAKECTEDLLLKSYPTHPARQKFLDDTYMFGKELMIYKVLLPELKRFSREQMRGFGDELKLALPEFIDGNCDGCETDEQDIQNRAKESEVNLLRNYILMVDVRKWGFKMAEKSLGLDHNHCQLVIAELAKFHALNWAYKTKTGLNSIEDKFPFVEEMLFCSRQQPLLSGMLNQNFEMMKDCVEIQLGSSSEAFKGFMRFENNLFENFLLIFDKNGVDEERLASLFRVKPRVNTAKGKNWLCGSHGDMWVNNFLFKYNENGVPTETIFVDLQLYHESSPIVDLAYFLYSSTNTALRRQYLNSLLQLYYVTFTNTCRQLNVEPFPGFSLAELQRRFELAKVFGFTTALLVLPIILVKPESAVDMDNTPANESQDRAEMLDIFKDIGKNTSQGNSALSERIVELVVELYEYGLI